MRKKDLLKRIESLEFSKAVVAKSMQALRDEWRENTSRLLEDVRRLTINTTGMALHQALTFNQAKGLWEIDPEWAKDHPMPQNQPFNCPFQRCPTTLKCQASRICLAEKDQNP